MTSAPTNTIQKIGLVETAVHRGMGGSVALAELRYLRNGHCGATLACAVKVAVAAGQILVSQTVHVKSVTSSGYSSAPAIYSRLMCRHMARPHMVPGPGSSGRHRVGAPAVCTATARSSTYQEIDIVHNGAAALLQSMRCYTALPMELELLVSHTLLQSMCR